MASCRWMPAVERWFDGEAADADAARRHVEACPDCAAHIARLRALRAGVEAVRKHEEIRDAQFSAFMHDIRQRAETPVRGYRRVWALLSVSAAALIVAIAAFLVFSSGPQPVDATVVESLSTDIKGATVTSYDTKDGVATIWVQVPAAQDDIL